MTEAFTAGSATEELSREASVVETNPLDASLSMSLLHPSLPTAGSSPDGTSPDGTVRQRRILNGSRMLEPGVIQRCVLEAARGSKEYVSAYTAGRGAE